MYEEASAPIFLRIKEQIKGEILAGVYAEEELILSTTQIAKLFGVNPATAVKSVSLLAEEGIVCKKRGIGMCVTKGAVEKIRAERTEKFHRQLAEVTVREAKKLGIGKDALLEMLLRAAEEEGL